MQNRLASAVSALEMMQRYKKYVFKSDYELSTPQLFPTPTSALSRRAFGDLPRSQSERIISDMVPK